MERGRVMSGDLGHFLEACGANGPLRLEWDDGETGRPVCRDFERPAIIIGRNISDTFVNYRIHLHWWETLGRRQLGQK